MELPLETVPDTPKHSRFAPSSAHRWMQCPASVPLEEEAQERGLSRGTSPEAEEGTAAHELAYLCLSQDRDAADFRDVVVNGHTVDPWMEHFVQEFLDYVRSIGEKASVVWLEERLSLARSLGDETAGGTADFIAVTFSGGEAAIELVDLKYGKGVRVNAEHNHQLLLYAQAAMDALDHLGPFDRVMLHIHQPRLDHISTFEVTPDFIAEHTAKARQAVLEVQGGRPSYYPAEDTCRFCDAAGICPALRDKVQNEVVEHFSDLTETEQGGASGDSDGLTTEQLADAMSYVPFVEQWAKSVREAVHNTLERGGDVPGWKLVEGRRTRQWTDEDAVVTKLRGQKFKKSDMYKQTLLSPAQVEKLLGKKKYEKLMTPVVDWQPGKPTLAPESDNRPSLEMFSDLDSQDGQTPTQEDKEVQE